MSVINSVLDGVMTVIYMGGYLIVLGIIVSVAYVLLSYKHKLVIRELTDENDIGYTTIRKCREFKDKEGGAYWRLLGAKNVDIPSPPPGFFSMTKGAAKFAEGFMYDDNISWIKPDPKEKYLLREKTQEERDIEKVAEADMDEICANLGDAPQYKKKGVTKLGDYFHKLDLFTGTQRWAYQQRLKAAFNKRIQLWDKLMPLINIGVVLMVLVILFVFYHDYSQTPLQMMDKFDVVATKFQGTAELLNSNAEILEEIQLERQRMEPVAPDPGDT